LTGVSKGNLFGRVLFGFASTAVLVFRFFLGFFVGAFLGAFFVGAFFVVFAFAFGLLVDFDLGLLVAFLDVVFVLVVFSDTVVTEP
jgi:asparagine N-glycosylation enzyme membrane subunit Stt3